MSIVENIVVYDLEQQSEEIQANLNMLERIIEIDNYERELFWIFWSGGANIEAERETIQFDTLAAYSATLNMNAQQSVINICNNLNQASDWTNTTINCSLVGLNGIPDKSELKKMEESRLKVTQLEISLSNQISGIGLEIRGWMAFKNLVYIVAVISTGLVSLIPHLSESPKAQKSH